MAQTGQQPDDDDVRFGDDIDEVLSRANPNPERIGCPPRETLIGLARRAQPLGDPAYEHLVKCSPCYREFRALQQQTVARPAPVRARGRRWAVAAAAILAVAGGIAAFRLLAPEPRPSDSGTSRVLEDAPQRTELDLRKYTVLRREQGAPQAEAVTLPSSVVELTLLLPVGSEAGSYEIQVLDSELKSRAAVRATADIRDFVTTIRATVDLRSVPSGNYQLALRREGDDWRMFPAHIGK